MSIRETIFTFMSGLALASLLIMQSAPATAAECPRGTLDAQYCDRDGDQIADLPTDPADWVNPDTLIFAYTPVEDPAVYKSVWAGFIDHMAKVTGKEVLFFSVQSNAAQLEAMRSGRLHVAGFNTGSNPIAVSCAGFSDVDFQTDFSGKHDNSVMGIANGDYEVASIANSVMRRMIDRGVVDPANIRTIYKSQTFPTTGYGHAHNLDPTLVALIKQSFFTFEWEGSALKEEFQKSGEGKFISIVHKFDWNVIRKIDTANGIEYACK